MMDRIAAKNDIVLKDVRHVNSYGLVLDLLFMGLQQPSEMAGPPVMPLRYRDTSTKAQHPIRLYGRHGDKIHILLRITADDSRELIQGFSLFISICFGSLCFTDLHNSLLTDPNNNDNISHNSKHCWPLNGAAKERTAQAYPCVSDHKIDQFHSQIQQVLMARGSTTFSKIVNK
ncbi:hypothetical protein MJO29_008272 [Puccinia striiformis f. sp. tritici]|nr:hypothetical protein MJO29_008272 [Puccinia striiformis f. sp. tritici]